MFQPDVLSFLNCNQIMEKNEAFNSVTKRSWTRGCSKTTVDKMRLVGGSQISIFVYIQTEKCPCRDR